MVALQQRTGPCHQMVPIFNHAQVAAAAQKRQTREVHGFDWIIVFFLMVTVQPFGVVYSARGSAFSRPSRNSIPSWRCTGSRSYPSGRSQPTVRLCALRCTTHGRKDAPWPEPPTRTSLSSLSRGKTK